MNVKGEWMVLRPWTAMGQWKVLGPWNIKCEWKVLGQLQSFGTMKGDM